MASGNHTDRKERTLIDWIPTPQSSRTEAIAYLIDEEAILARFTDGKEWRYDSCPAHVWEEFSDPATSKGGYIHQQLNHHTNYEFVA